MALVNTAQGIPYPDKNETVNDVHNDIKALAQALDKKIVGTYANAAALQAAGVFPAGSMVYMADSKTVQVYNGTAWVTIPTGVPRVYSGTTAPSSALGAVGDIYVQY